MQTFQELFAQKCQQYKKGAVSEAKKDLKSYFKVSTEMTHSEN